MQGWVIFDLDGTLIESEQTWRDVRRDFVVEHGGHWREEAQTAMMGMRTDDWAGYMHAELGVNLPCDTIKEDILKAVIDRFAVGVPVFPGASETLERIAPNFRLGLATSAALPVARAVLAETGWERYFAVVVSADSVARGKPAPDVYLRAIELLAANLALSAAIEDSANGIRSAHAAGLNVIAVPNREFPPDGNALSLAARVVASLDAVTSAMIRSVLPTIEH